MKEQDWIYFLRKYRGALVGGLLGIILLILWTYVGFWKSLFSLIFIVLCALLGYSLSKHGVAGIVRFIEKIFK